MIKIYADGSAKNNGKHNSTGGFGVIVFNDEDRISHVYNDHFDNVTNNQMELQALLYALELTQSRHYKDVTIFTDSSYCSRIWNEWISIWAKQDWKRKGNKEILNLNLIQSLYKYYILDFIHCQVKIQHCDGHSGIIGNELADALATMDYDKFNKIVRDNNILLDE